MGDFEIFYSSMSIIILGFLMYNVMNCFSFSEILKKYGFLKYSSSDFYECGFSPLNQKPMKLPIQFLLICIFFLLYDIELIFLFPFVSGITFLGIYDFLLILIFFFLFLISLIFDFNSHALIWQY